MFHKFNETDDLLRTLLEELDQKSFLQSYQVSKRWHQFFPTLDWKKKITKDFQIDDSILSHFSSESLKDKKFYQNIYQRLYALTNQTNYPTLLHFQRILKDKYKRLLLIACCSDIPSLVNEIMFEEQRDCCVEIALYAKCNKVAISLIPETTMDKLSYFAKAIEAGNLEIAQHILKFERDKKEFQLFMSSAAAYEAAASGHIDLFQFFFNLKLNFNHQEALCRAAKSGSVKLVSYLLDPDNKFNVELDHDVLFQAFESGNEKLVSFLLKLNNKKEQPILLKSDNIAHNAISVSGNTKLFSYLEGNHPANCLSFFGMDYAMTSESLDMVVRFLNVATTIKDSPISYVNLLNLAVMMANKELISYFLNLPNLFLYIESEHFEKVMESGLYDSALYLLDPGNKFGLEITNTILLHAFPRPKFSEDMVDDILIGIEDYSLLVMEHLDPLDRKNWELLQPEENNFTTPLDVLFVIMKNLTCLQRLIISHEFMELMKVRAIVDKDSFEEDDRKAMTSVLRVVYVNAPTHFYHCIEYLLSQKSVNADLMTFVHSFLDELKKSQTPLQQLRHCYLLPQKEECVDENKILMRI